MTELNNIYIEVNINHIIESIELSHWSKKSIEKIIMNTLYFILNHNYEYIGLNRFVNEIWLLIL